MWARPVQRVFEQLYVAGLAGLRVVGNRLGAVRPSADAYLQDQVAAEAVVGRSVSDPHEAQPGDLGEAMSAVPAAPVRGRSSVGLL
jgi:hypothetical protein